MENRGHFPLSHSKSHYGFDDPPASYPLKSRKSQKTSFPRTGEVLCRAARAVTGQPVLWLAAALPLTAERAASAMGFVRAELLTGPLIYRMETCWLSDLLKRRCTIARAKFSSAHWLRKFGAMAARFERKCPPERRLNSPPYLRLERLCSPAARGTETGRKSQPDSQHEST